jgi:DNA-binding GntR family transcriptional regulator
MPQYRQLYEMLRKHIEEGVYHVGDLLPSENELSSLHRVARLTVRQALAALVNDGYIRKQKGKGSIVTPLPKGIGILSVEGTTTALASMNLTTTIVSKPRVMRWPRDFMFPLPEEIRESGCIYMERIRLINAKPLFYDISHLPNINLPRFCMRNFENRSLFDTLRKYYGIEVHGGEQKLRAIPATKKIARYLKIKEGTPVLHLERKLDTNRTGYSFYSSIYCITSEHALFGTF